MSFLIVVLCIIVIIVTILWNVNGLFALNKTDKVLTAYIDWKYEDFTKVEEREEPLGISALFDAVQRQHQYNKDPFAVFSDRNREQFRQWYQDRHN